MISYNRYTSKTSTSSATMPRGITRTSLTTLVLLACVLTICYMAGASLREVGSLSFLSRPSLALARLFAANATKSDSREAERNCKPVNDVFFLKTHKCASSSLQNLFMRYGKNRNLTFVLPSYGNYLGSPARFSSRMMMQHPSGVYNIFCHHSRYSETQVRAVMPYATFVSILRRPAELLESLYSFSKLTKLYGVDFDMFIRRPDAYFARHKPGHPPAMNTMLFDFGLDTIDSLNRAKVDAKIATIAKQFSLIMIAERFDESLVLLRDELCWSWDDVVVFKQNARIRKTRLTEEQLALVDAWSAGDAALYQHFYPVFEDKVRRYGAARMQRDLAALHEHTQRMYDHCVDHLVTQKEIHDPKLKSWSADVFNFRLKSNDSACIDLAKAELPFTTELKRRLWPNKKFVV
ncbi:PREDICTED: galactosylceramide sulfotransferase-like isoform X2 [Priapulus caudatus]|uniref:Galactosylceramide sulfotransferase-like isoform X2 n=1 Tax=Priapulus caudatus TaxID=37621 RepID=A0ABM1F9Y6_PRICU|nr:PREDICTED: galactosylceramide sulfotransferase-like isoform X2 [Priapulus caudatus]